MAEACIILQAINKVGVSEAPLGSRVLGGRLHEAFPNRSLFVTEQAQNAGTRMPVGIGECMADGVQSCRQLSGALCAAEVEVLDTSSKDLSPPEVLPNPKQSTVSRVLPLLRVATLMMPIEKPEGDDVVEARLQFEGCMQQRLAVSARDLFNTVLSGLVVALHLESMLKA